MSTVSNAPISDVAEFYANRSIFITGATGFLGKVLVEKLLRSCPKLRNIYVLVRPRDEQTAEQRWCKVVENGEIFRNLRDSKRFQTAADKFFDADQSPTDLHPLDKVVPVSGDIVHDDLGINADDAKIICENVSVVFHCAATVKFDEHIRLAVRMNVDGTRRLLRLCDKMKHLDAFVHTSTAYANCDLPRIEERVYKSSIDWRRLIDMAEWMNDSMLDSLVPQLLGAKPNTYTFTKAVAESMIVDNAEANHHFPVIIVRPSIITAIWKEPTTGWIDNVNAATGVIALGAKGLLRALCGPLHTTRADLIPVDIVANVLIVSAWHRAVGTGPLVPVVHCTTGILNPVSWSDVIETTLVNFTEKMPLLDLYRIPGGNVTTNRLEYRLRLFFDHLIPAYLLDALGSIRAWFRRRPDGARSLRMLRVYKKMQKVISTLEYFYTHQWDFDSDTLAALNEQLSETDRDEFYVDVRGIDWGDYFEKYDGGVRKYIFKEDESTIQAAKRVQFKRRVLTKVASYTIYLLALYAMQYMLRYTWVGTMFQYMFDKVNMLNIFSF